MSLGAGFTIGLNGFEANRKLLEDAYGRELVFEELPSKRACRIADYREDADVADLDHFDDFIDWFFDAGERLRKALAAIEDDSGSGT